jgi:chaperonin cofactor prefoldin
MDYDPAPSSMRASHRGPRKAKKSPPPVPDIRAISEQLLATLEMLRQELPRLFHPQPLPGRLMDAIRQLHEFALAESNEPDAGEIGMLLIEQLRQELGQALAMHRDWLLKELARMNEQLARLDEVHAQTRQLSELQNHFRPLGV